MTRRIFRAICLVAISVLLASVFLMLESLYEYFSEVQREQLHRQTAIAAHAFELEGEAAFREQEDLYRVTWIAADGTVLYDSVADVEDMDNHRSRDEVLEAFATGYGEASRFSDSLTDYYLYAAVLLADGTVLRLSLRQSSVLALLLDVAPSVCIIFACAMVVSVLLAARLSRRIVKPLNELDLEHPMKNRKYEELSPLLQRIDSQQAQLKKQEEALLHKQNELNIIIESMSEGMVLVNRDGVILSINPAACRLLELAQSCIGTRLSEVLHLAPLLRLLNGALAGNAASETVLLANSAYQIDASPVLSDGETKGAAICMFDRTDAARAEQQRREFTANVSHELKTPLHAISGYAELLRNGMVKKEDIQPFAGRIYDEAQRMIQLVEDVISLSHLDEGAVEERRDPIDLYDLASAVLRGLENQAAAAAVSLTLSGEPVVLRGVPRLLHSIVYNLCDNAVKYNRPGGQVFVTVCREKDEAVLTVRDTGIGIPAEEQQRIFERFYRVDKSRSKEVGGTGLGLSIVKHAAQVHGATIDLQSTVGEGTCMTVRFPLTDNM